MNSPTAKKLVKKEGDDENFQAQKKLKIGDDENFQAQKKLKIGDDENFQAQEKLKIGDDENLQAQEKLKIGDDENLQAQEIGDDEISERDKLDEDMNDTGYDPETTEFPDTDEELSPIVRVCETYDSEEDYCPDYPNGKMDKPLWEKYYKQIKESEGFDIEDFPGRCWMTTVFPLPYYLDNPDNYNKLKDYASKALKQYNDVNATCYEVDKMLKVNGAGCYDFIYYLTFTVKNGVDDIFQAKVVEEMDHSFEFPIVRPKPKA